MEKRGDRPYLAATSRTCAIRWAIPSSGSPQSMYVSAFFAPASSAGPRGTSEVERDARLGRGLDDAVRALEPVELALVVEGLVGGERPAQDLHVLGGPPVAVIVRDEVAVPVLVGLVATGDEVNRDAAAAGEVVERRELARHEGRLGESGPVGNEHAQPLGDVQRVRRDREPVDPGRAIADQPRIESGPPRAPGRTG